MSGVIQFFAEVERPLDAYLAQYRERVRQDIQSGSAQSSYYLDDESLIEEVKGLAREYGLTVDQAREVATIMRQLHAEAIDTSHR